jgi:hypothetical protein
LFGVCNPSIAEQEVVGDMDLTSLSIQVDDEGDRDTCQRLDCF